MTLFFQEEQVWLSRGDGGVPDVVARFHTKVSTKLEENMENPNRSVAKRPRCY